MKKSKNEDQHTPGPWVKKIVFPPWERAYYAIKAEGHSSFLFRVYNITGDEELANAHLICTAPELLTVARAVIVNMTERYGFPPDLTKENISKPDRELLEQAVAAIRKAKGVL
jgi:hypothetical protein